MHTDRCDKHADRNVVQKDAGKKLKCSSLYMKSASIYSELHTHAQSVTICCRNTDLVHVNGRDRIILVVLSQALYKAPWWWILCDPKHFGALLNVL